MTLSALLLVSYKFFFWLLGHLLFFTLGYWFIIRLPTSSITVSNSHKFRRWIIKFYLLNNVLQWKIKLKKSGVVHRNRPSASSLWFVTTRSNRNTTRGISGLEKFKNKILPTHPISREPVRHPCRYPLTRLRGPRCVWQDHVTFPATCLTFVRHSTAVLCLHRKSPPWFLILTSPKPLDIFKILILFNFRGPTNFPFFPIFYGCDNLLLIIRGLWPKNFVLGWNIKFPMCYYDSFENYLLRLFFKI